MKTDNLRGIRYLIAGIGIFSCQDLILKLLSGNYPLHEAMLVRSLAAIPCLLILAHYDGGLHRLRTRAWPQLTGRGLMNFGAYTSYYLALAALRRGRIVCAQMDLRARRRVLDRVREQVEHHPAHQAQVGA